MKLGPIVRTYGARALAWRLGWALRRRVGRATGPKPAHPPGWSRAAMLRAWRRLDGWDELAQRVDDGTIGAVMARLLHEEERADILEEARRDTAVIYGHKVVSTAWSSSASAVDIKDDWEPGRAAHTVSLARAHALDPSPEWARALRAHLEAFARVSPYGEGVHWTNGQEVALRAVTWCTVACVLTRQACWTDADAELLGRLLFEHVWYVDHHIDYARYVTPNNHLLAEALAMRLGAALFADAAPVRWSERGAALWEEAGRDQFLEDGGYCQASHTYHRLAMGLVAWSVRAMGDTGWETQALRRSVDFLASFLGPEGGLPNWGANDGAHLLPLSSCATPDVRPELQAVSALAHRARIVGEGGRWDEAALWWTARDPAGLPVRPVARQATYPVSGVHVMRRAGATAWWRCGAPTHRFGQADQLHTGLVWEGEPLTLDPGSYRYAGAPRIHDWMIGTLGHSTVSLDRRDQAQRVGRFVWGTRPSARQVHFDPASWEAIAEVTWPDHLGTHRRTIVVERWGFTILDEVHTTTASLVRLHWLLRDASWALAPAGASSWWIEADLGFAEVSMRLTHSGATGAPYLVRARDEPEVGGWHAPMYAHREPAVSLVWEEPARGVANWVTEVRCTSS
ncbi:MAG: heparinase II/III family protein [Myxococcota bacterium]